MTLLRNLTLALALFGLQDGARGDYIYVTPWVGTGGPSIGFSFPGKWVEIRSSREDLRQILDAMHLPQPTPKKRSWAS